MQRKTSSWSFFTSRRRETGLGKEGGDRYRRQRHERIQCLATWLSTTPDAITEPSAERPQGKGADGHVARLISLSESNVLEKQQPALPNSRAGLSKHVNIGAILTGFTVLLPGIKTLGSTVVAMTQGKSQLVHEKA